MEHNKMRSFIAIVLACTLMVSIAGNPTVFASSVTETDDSSATPVVEVAEVAPEPTAEEIAKAALDARNAVIEANNVKLKAQIAEINTQLETVEAEQVAIRNNISAVKGERGEAEAELYNIDSKISATQSEISLLDNKIATTEELITGQEVAIEGKKETYQENYDMFLGRVRAMDMYDDSTTIGLVLGTDDFVDFLTTTDNLERIADHDRALMAKLDAERVALEEEMADMEETKASLADSRKISASKQGELSVQRTSANAVVQDIANLQSQYEKELSQSQAKAAAMEAEISNAYSQIKLSEEAYVGGQMAWPVPGYSNITSSYGWRFGGRDFHTGMDISGGGVHGKPVVAANDGTVVVVNWAYKQGSGYGIYVMIDHGGGFTTLYGHLSNITVSNGQTVTRGQTIGAVGSTGWSTGPHLHFEVRKDKKHVDPYPYVS